MRGLCLACVLVIGSVTAQTEIVPESNEDTTTTTTTTSTTTTTEAPVVIVKQVNEINEDGSYTVGYEASDGSFKLETKDAEGNVAGKYGFVDENGEIKIVEYSANNSTGFNSDLEAPELGAPVPEADPAFELEKQRHEAVLAFQQSVIDKQQQIARQRDATAQKQNFANNRQGPRRPVFNAANFNPNRPAAEQFNTQNFQQDFRDFQQQQQPQQFAQQPQQQFIPQQPQQQQFNSQFNQNQQFAQNQQQFAPQQQQQFAPQQQQQQFQTQFNQNQPQFVPQQQQQQFVPPQLQQQQQFPQQVPLSQLTREQIALEGFSRDDDQDGQIDPLPAHLQPQQQPQPAFQNIQPQQQQQFVPKQQQQQFVSQQQQQQFAHQQQQFLPQQFNQPQQEQFRQQQQVQPSFQQQQQPLQPAFQQPQQQQTAFRTPQPVGPSPVNPQQQFFNPQPQQF